MKIKESNECKTGFQVWYGRFEHQVMAFRLSNAPASFQDYINKILAKKLNLFIIVYLDDIFIYTKDPSQAHVDVIWWVLKELRNYSFCQPQKVPISQGQSLLFRLRFISLRSANGGWKDKSSKELVWIKICEWYPSSSWFRQFLLMFHSGL